MLALSDSRRLLRTDHPTSLQIVPRRDCTLPNGFTPVIRRARVAAMLDYGSGAVRWCPRPALLPKFVVGDLARRIDLSDDDDASVHPRTHMQRKTPRYGQAGPRTPLEVYLSTPPQQWQGPNTTRAQMKSNPAVSD
jgi:hypothetical protein